MDCIGSLPTTADGSWCCVVVGTVCKMVGQVPHRRAAGWWTLAKISLTECDDGQQYAFGTDDDCGGDGLLHAFVVLFNDVYGYDE